MPENAKPNCPECDDRNPSALDRRNFMKVVGGTTAALTVGALAARGLRADEPKPTETKKPVKPAEDLVKELFSDLNAEQKKDALFDFNEKGGPAGLKRLGMYNASIATPIGKIYTKPQQELIDRIVRAIASGEDGYQKLSRNGTWDNSSSLANCGAHFFGDPLKGEYSWVFSGHHLTVRCDGNFTDGIGFGGPMYYGHSPNGYSDKNCFWYQTKRVLEVFDALNEEQRKKAVVKGTPGEQAPSVKFRAKLEEMPGVMYADLSGDQKALIEAVMRDVLAPYRKEDVDEVMSIVKTNGGMDKMHLAFYQDDMPAEKTPWHFWRLEGPGFVWNYRVLPHVHTYVNISSKI
jgi:hypothetical protein